MNFIEAIVVPLRSLIISTLGLTSNTLDYWVNLSANEPLTDNGAALVDSLAKIAITFTEFIARVLFQTL